MFKVSGATVYPGEVERALRDHRWRPQRIRHERACRTGAIGWVRPWCATRRGDRRAAARRARNLLSSFKVPTVWLLVESDDDVPRGGTGKVDVPRLRELLGDGALGDPRPALAVL